MEPLDWLCFAFFGAVVLYIAIVAWFYVEGRFGGMP